MPEPITSQLVADVLTDLLEAFPPYRGKETFNVIRKATIYRDGLGGLTGEALRAAAKLVIQNDEKFPKVARLRQLATEWTRRNMAVPTTRDKDADEKYCTVCGAKAQELGNRITLLHDARKHGVFVSTAEDT